MFSRLLVFNGLTADSDFKLFEIRFVFNILIYVLVFVVKDVLRVYECLTYV